MIKNLRVALFPDSYTEMNGVATTCRRLVEYARGNEQPLLCVRAGQTTEILRDGSITFLSLKRSPLSLHVERDLAYDPLFQRHCNRVAKELEKFRPDIIHITGLNDVSIIGAYLAWKMQLPLIGSWHTNMHEFAARRLYQSFSFLPSAARSWISNFAERKIMDGTLLFYKMPKIVLAPNNELVEIIQNGNGRTTRLMLRGVDTDKFNPAKRTVNDGIFRFGFAGRLRPEKNVRLLVDLEQALLAAGKSNFEFLVVGEGGEREFLEKNLRHATFTGYLEGDELAAAYANMDVFIFPSETDTYGNVIQEANASGVPAIVSDKGGPKFVIEPERSGFIAQDLTDFIRYSKRLLEDPGELEKMRLNSREVSELRSWDSVFDGVYDAYEESINLANNTKTESDLSGNKNHGGTNNLTGVAKL